MARRPRKVIIGDNDYKLVSRSKAWGERHDAMGMFHYERPLIELADHGSDGLELVNTVIHEILHGIIHEYEIEMDGRIEERLVRCLSEGLTDVCKENPNLLEWVRLRLKKENEKT